MVMTFKVILIAALTNVAMDILQAARQGELH